jgi:hypothetical protein
VNTASSACTRASWADADGGAADDAAGFFARCFVAAGFAAAFCVAFCFTAGFCVAGFFFFAVDEAEDDRDVGGAGCDEERDRVAMRGSVDGPGSRGQVSARRRTGAACHAAGQR